MSVGEVTVEIIIIVTITIDVGMRNQDQEVERDPHTIIIITRGNTSVTGTRRKRASIAAHRIAHIHQVVVQVRIKDAIEGGVGVEEMMAALGADRHLRSIKKNVDMAGKIDMAALPIKENKI
jgi:hypothetical protein